MKYKGFTLIEFILAIAITVVIVMVVGLFAKDIISINSSAQSSMTAMLEGRKIISVMVKELRSAVPSAQGSYPIESVSTSSIVFFADVDSDDVADRVRLFLDHTTLSVKRGVIAASGDPPAYTGSETFSTLVNNITNGTATPLFDYYDGNTTLLSYPLTLSAIRLIKVTIKIDKDPSRAPSEVTITSQAMLRNLKDNL